MDAFAGEASVIAITVDVVLFLLSVCLAQLGSPPTPVEGAPAQVAAFGMWATLTSAQLVVALIAVGTAALTYHAMDSTLRLLAMACRGCPSGAGRFAPGAGLRRQSCRRWVSSITVRWPQA